MFMCFKICLKNIQHKTEPNDEIGCYYSILIFVHEFTLNYKKKQTKKVKMYNKTFLLDFS